MGLNIPFPNAFTINTLNGAFIPLSVAAYEHNGTLGMDLFPQRLLDLCNLLQPFESMVVFGVEQTSVMDDKGRRPLSIAEVAAADYIAHREIDAETIMVTPGNLARLLAGFFHTQLQAFDARSMASEDELITSVFASIDHSWTPKTTLLPELAGSNLYLSTHDDCYLHVEAYNPALLQAVIGRAVRTYIGTVMAQADDKQSASVAELPQEYLDWLWSMAAGLTILREHTVAEPDGARVGIIWHEIDLQRAKEYPVDFVLGYQAETGGWFVE